MQMDIPQYSSWLDVSSPMLESYDGHQPEMVTAPASRTSSFADNNVLWPELALMPLMPNEAGMLDDASDVSSIGSASQNSIYGDLYLGFENPNGMANEVESEAPGGEREFSSDLSREVGVKVEDSSSKLLNKRTRRLTPSQKKAHNQVEKRYRAGINDKILSLKNLLPSGLDDSSRMNKSRILDMVHDYIVMLKKSQEDLYNENLILKLQIL